MTGQEVECFFVREADEEAIGIREMGRRERARSRRTTYTLEKRACTFVKRAYTLEKCAYTLEKRAYTLEKRACAVLTAYTLESSYVPGRIRT